MLLWIHVLEFYVTIFNESLYPSQKDGNDESPLLGETLFSVDLSSFDGHDCLRYPWRWTEDNYFSSRLQIIWQSTITSSLTFDRFAVSQCIISLRVPSWPWNSVVSSPYRNRICRRLRDMSDSNSWMLVCLQCFLATLPSNCNHFEYLWTCGVYPLLNSVRNCTDPVWNKSSVNLTFHSKCCGQNSVGKSDGRIPSNPSQFCRNSVDLVWHHWRIPDHL